MSDRQYIIVRNWDEFQHYKNRTPPWIKTYTELLSDEAYRDLSGHRRAVLHGLWLEYARSRCRLRLDTLSLTRRLGLRVTTTDIEALNDAGFITLSASATLATCKQDASASRAREEKRREEKETPPTPPRGDEVREIYDHWRQQRRKTDPRYASISENRRRKIQARLREFPADELKRAIDLVALDPWEDRPRHDDLTVIFRSREQVDKFLSMADKPAADPRPLWERGRV